MKKKGEYGIGERSDLTVRYRENGELCLGGGEALPWFYAASGAGLATADYEIAVFFKKGYCGLPVDGEKAETYLAQYQKRCEESERQRILAWDIDGDWRVIGRSHMFGWFCASVPELYDTPNAKPSKWKYGV